MFKDEDGDGVVDILESRLGFHKMKTTVFADQPDSSPAPIKEEEPDDRINEEEPKEQDDEEDLQVDSDFGEDSENSSKED